MTQKRSCGGPGAVPHVPRGLGGPWTMRGATPRVWTPTTPYPPTNCWGEAPLGGGGAWEGLLGGWGVRGAFGGGPGVRGALGGVIWGRVGWAGAGGRCPQRPSVTPSQAPLTSPCPPSNNTIPPNLTLTFAASWLSHANHVDWAEQDSPNFVHGCFCHIIALDLTPTRTLASG